MTGLRRRPALCTALRCGATDKLVAVKKEARLIWFKSVSLPGTLKHWKWVSIHKKSLYKKWVDCCIYALLITCIVYCQFIWYAFFRYCYHMLCVKNKRWLAEYSITWVIKDWSCSKVTIWSKIMIQRIVMIIMITENCGYDLRKSLKRPDDEYTLWT